MHLHYASNKTKSFSGEGWSKKVIDFLLSTHIKAWISHCNEIHTSSSNGIKSLAHQSLIITVESLFDKGKSLPQHLQKWFLTNPNEITELSLHRLKTWICNTKQLIKLNKPTITDNRKITEFFNPFNVNIPTISNSHRKTPPTTSQEDSVNNNSLHHLQSNSSTITNLPPMKEKENNKQIAYSNQLFKKKKNNSTTPTFNPITDYFGPSPFKEDTSAFIRNYKNITITKSGQHHKSIIKNIINKNKKAKVLKKRHKENDQTYQHVTNVIDHAATPPSSLNMSQDCKVVGQYEQSPPMTVPQKIQPTFAITVPYAFSNTNIHYDTHIHGSPTTRARSKPEIAPEEENINENFINESLNENNNEQPVVKQTINTNNNSLVSNTIQQCINVIELNDRNQSQSENNGNNDNTYNNISITSLKSNDKVNLNHVYCYSINDNNTEKFILTTRKIIYTYSCGHKKSMTLQYTPIYSVNHNQSYKSNTKFSPEQIERCDITKSIALPVLYDIQLKKDVDLNFVWEQDD